MKSIREIMAQHAIALGKLAISYRAILGLIGLAVLIICIGSHVNPIITGLICATYAIVTQVFIGAWDVNEDKLSMAILFTWYTILYAAVASLF